MRARGTLLTAVMAVSLLGCTSVAAPRSTAEPRSAPPSIASALPSLKLPAASNDETPPPPHVFDPASISSVTAAAGPVALQDDASGDGYGYQATVTIADGHVYARGTEGHCGATCDGAISSGQWWRSGSWVLFVPDAPAGSAATVPSLSAVGTSGRPPGELAEADPTWVGVLPLSAYSITKRAVAGDGSVQLQLVPIRRATGFTISRTNALVDVSGKLLTWTQVVRNAEMDYTMTWVRTLTYGPVSTPSSPLAGSALFVPPVAPRRVVADESAIVLMASISDSGAAYLLLPPMAEGPTADRVLLEPRNGIRRIVPLSDGGSYVTVVGPDAYVTTSAGEVLRVALADGSVGHLGSLVRPGELFSSGEVTQIGADLVAVIATGHPIGKNVFGIATDHVAVALLRDGAWLRIGSTAVDGEGSVVVVGGTCGWLQAATRDDGHVSLSLVGLDCASGSAVHLDLGTLASVADPGAPASVLGRPVGLSPTESVVAADIGTGAPVAVAIVADGAGSVHAIDLGTRWTLPDALSGPTALYLLGGSVISRPGTIVRF